MVRGVSRMTKSGLVQSAISYQKCGAAEQVWITTGETNIAD